MTLKRSVNDLLLILFVSFLQPRQLNAKSFQVRRLLWADGVDGKDVEEDEPTEVYDAPWLQAGFEGFLQVILGADITYDCKGRSLDALLRLIRSCSHPKTQTFLAHGLRNVERAMWLVCDWLRGPEFGMKFTKIHEGLQRKRPKRGRGSFRRH